MVGSTPYDMGGDRGAEDQLDLAEGQLAGRARADIRLHGVARDHHGPQPPPLPARDIGRDHPGLVRQHARDDRILAMRASGENDRGGLQLHGLPTSALRRIRGWMERTPGIGAD